MNLKNREQVVEMLLDIKEDNADLYEIADQIVAEAKKSNGASKPKLYRISFEIESYRELDAEQIADLIDGKIDEFFDVPDDQLFGSVQACEVELIS